MTKISASVFPIITPDTRTKASWLIHLQPTVIFFPWQRGHGNTKNLGTQWGTTLQITGFVISQGVYSWHTTITVDTLTDVSFPERNSKTTVVFDSIHANALCLWNCEETFTCRGYLISLIKVHLCWKLIANILVTALAEPPALPLNSKKSDTQCGEASNQNNTNWKSDFWEFVAN